jgi:hypothetical protein
MTQATKPGALTMETLKSGLLIQRRLPLHGEREVYQVSTVYPRYFTAQLLLPIPGRTTVREFGTDELRRFRTITAHRLHALDAAYQSAHRTRR